MLMNGSAYLGDASAMASFQSQLRMLKHATKRVKADAFTPQDDGKPEVLVLRPGFGPGSATVSQFSGVERPLYMVL